MRNFRAPCVAVALPLALVFLAVVPQETQSQDPMSIARGAAAVLSPLIKQFMSLLSANRVAESIKIRVWMHNGDRDLNGCGLYMRVDGFAGGYGETHFPPTFTQKCGSKKYEMRMTSQSANYDADVRLGNQQVERIEVHADGWHNTYINLMCIGMHERTIAGGPRAFCINNELLQGCKGLTRKWSSINIDWDDIMLTRTNRGAHKIVFTDIERLVRAFERLDQDPENEKAIRTICNRIDLVRGTYKDKYWDCPAQKTWEIGSGSGVYFQTVTKYKKEDKNPYGCKRYAY